MLRASSADVIIRQISQVGQIRQWFQNFDRLSKRALHQHDVGQLPTHVTDPVHFAGEFVLEIGKDFERLNGVGQLRRLRVELLLDTDEGLQVLLGGLEGRDHPAGQVASEVRAVVRREPCAVFDRIAGSNELILDGNHLVGNRLGRFSVFHQPR